MKIVHVITGLGVGGAERVVMEIAPRMLAAGNDVSIVVIGSECRILDQYQDFPAAVFLLNVDKRNPLSLLLALMSFLKILRGMSVDIVHAHMFHALVFSLLAKAFSPRRFSLFFTSHSFSGFKGLRRLVIRGCRFFRDGDVVFSGSQHPDLNSKAVFVIPNGVRVGRAACVRAIKQVNEPFVFIFVGRLEAPKNPLAILRAFAQIPFLNAYLHVVGDGYLRPELESEVRKLGVEDRVVFFGVQPNVKSFLDAADCFVMASLWEGLPMALLEAGAVGLPAISTPVGAIPEILNGDCGWVMSEDCLHLAMLEAISNPADAVVRGEKLRFKIFREYSIEGAVASHLLAYSRILGKK